MPKSRAAEQTGSRNLYTGCRRIRVLLLPDAFKLDRDSPVDEREIKLGYFARPLHGYRRLRRCEGLNTAATSFTAVAAESRSRAAILERLTALSIAPPPALTGKAYPAPRARTSRETPTAAAIFAIVLKRGSSFSPASRRDR
jgi:hypothetical protein